MSNELVPADITATAVAQVDEKRVLQYLGINVSDPRAQATMLIAQKYNLDPLLKHVQLIQHGPYITRDGYLHIAHKSGVFDGMETLEEKETEQFFYAKVAVYRKDMSRPFVMGARYPKKGNGGQADPVDMALVRATRRALKMAFDVSVPGAMELGDDVDLFMPADGDAVMPPQVVDVPETQALDARVAEPSGPDEPEQAEAKPKPKAKRAPAKPKAAKPQAAVPSPPDDEPLVPEVINEDTPLEPKEREENYKGVDGVKAKPEPFPDQTDAELAVNRGFPGTVAEGETGELADEVTLARLRRALSHLDEEHKAGVAIEWKKAHLGSMKEGKVRLLASKVDQADRLLRDQLVAQKDIYERRRKHIHALLTEVGVTSDTGRHDLIRTATDGTAESSKALLGREVKQINDYVERLKAEDRGEE